MKKFFPIQLIILCLCLIFFSATSVSAQSNSSDTSARKLLAWNGWEKAVSWFKKTSTPPKATVVPVTPVAPKVVSPTVVLPKVQPTKVVPVKKAVLKKKVVNKKNVVVKAIVPLLIPETSNQSTLVSPVASISLPVDTTSKSVVQPMDNSISNQNITSETTNVEQTVDTYIQPIRPVVVDVGGMRPEYPITVAKAISNKGDVVGNSMKNNSESAHPFLYKNGKMIDVGGGYGGTANAVNDDGQVVGQLVMSYDYGAGGGTVRPFIWDNGKITKIGVSPGIAFDINNKKQVVGYMWIGKNEGYPVHSFIWEKGVTKYLGTLGGNDNEGMTTAYAINNLSQVVGCSIHKDGFQHPFLWENGKMKDLGNLYNEGGCAVDINDAGQVVGYFNKINSKDGFRGIEAFVWENDNITPLSDAPKDFWPYGINNRGDIIGSKNGVTIRRNGVYRQYSQINDWTIYANDGVDINDNGQIVAVGKKIEGQGNYGLMISLPDNAPPILENLKVDTVRGIKMDCQAQTNTKGCFEAKNMTITWDDNDVDSNANISLYYYEEYKGIIVDVNKPGKLIVDKINEDDSSNKYIWNVGADDVNNHGGEFYIYAVIDDDYNSPRKVYNKQMEQRLGWWSSCKAKSEGRSSGMYSEEEQKAMGGC